MDDEQKISVNDLVPRDSCSNWSGSEPVFFCPYKEVFSQELTHQLQ